ncbi:MAG: hypothetical protein WAK93_12395 [Solirubrobacteraceae bacterium]
MRLSRGAHKVPDEGACVVELASLLSGEPFSDRPKSVCPALRSFLHGYNDALPDHLREDLYALGSDIVGTRSIAAVTAWRARLCLGWGESVAPLVSVPVRFEQYALRNCMLAGTYSAQAARRDRWFHRQTLAFFHWLADARPPLLTPSPGAGVAAMPSCSLASEPHRSPALV